MENQESPSQSNVSEVNKIPPEIKKTNLIAPSIVIIGIIFLLIILIKLPVNKNDSIIPLPKTQQDVDSVKNQANIPDQKLSSTDHTMGNINARIVVFEYSDLDCPFCIQFHSTMKQLVKDYPNDVLWVYRHFPIDGLHPKARIESVASECVAKIGGNEIFWSFIDNAFAFTSSSVSDPIPTLKSFAVNLKIDSKSFDTCLFENSVDKKIDDIIIYQENLGISSGARGTPFSVIVDQKTGAMYPASGAQDINTMREIIKTILNDK